MDGWMDGSGIRSWIDGFRVRDGSNNLQRKTFLSLLNRWVRDVSYSLQRKDFNCVMFNVIPYFFDKSLLRYLFDIFLIRVC